MKEWDAFISYASEDKEVVVQLAEELRNVGLKIWLDQHELQLGDSLREKIDEGLAESRFGIVVLSPSFLGKRWPGRELNGLMALEESGHKVILPVWHGVDQDALIKYSPMLTDRVASDMARGISSVAADIVRVVVDPRNGSPASQSPTVARRLIELLEGASEPTTIRSLLSAHSNLVARAVGGGSLIKCGAQLDCLELDLCFERIEGTTRTHRWRIIQLAHPLQHPFPDGVNVAEPVAQKVAELERLRKWVSRNLPKAYEVLPHFNSSFLGFIVCGRRGILSPDDIKLLQSYNDELFGITLRTYDWLVETVVS